MPRGRSIQQPPSGWWPDDTIVNEFGTAIPELDGSRLMFGFGFNTGRVEAERVGTAYWVY